MTLEIYKEGSIDDTNKRLLLQPSNPTRIYLDTKDFIEDTKYQIYLQQEPESIYPIKQYLLTNCHKFDLILTMDSDVLSKCKNAKRFTFYTVTWLEKNYFENIDIRKKEFKISTVVGAKRITPAHDMRLLLYFNQNFFSHLPITFFRSCALPHLPEITNNPFLESKDSNAKHMLFTSFQFHLAIENSRQDNYFTEKLIDCLISKTIPIYYGCPNIHEYFNTSGWILLETCFPDEILLKLNVLDNKYYSKYLDVIESNYEKALYYKNHIFRLNEVLSSLPPFLKEI